MQVNFQVTMKFSTNTVLIHEEKEVCYMMIDSLTYLITRGFEFQVLDFAGIVGSVGGSLGLFLGFSCYATAKELIKRLKN